MAKPIVYSFEDPTGQRYGMLTCLKQVGRRGCGRVFRFRCDCGNEFEATFSDLKNKLHCGCALKPKPCVICGKIFQPKKSTSVYCSRECGRKWNAKCSKRWRENEGKQKSEKKKKPSLTKTIRDARKAGMSYGQYQATLWKEAKA